MQPGASTAIKARGYDGPWARQYAPLDEIIWQLEARQRKNKVWSFFLRNLIIFLLILLYSTISLDPHSRRALIAAAEESYVKVPFDVPGEGRIAGFEHIHNEDELWTWVNDVLLDKVFAEDGAFTTADRNTRNLWAVRFRQVMVSPQDRDGEAFEASRGDACDTFMMAPAIRDSNFSNIRCKYTNPDIGSKHTVETDFGFASTRPEVNQRGITVNVTSAEWQWKPNTFDEGIVASAARLNLVYDTSGFVVDVPLNRSGGMEKVFAMRYGRLENGQVIRSAAEAHANRAQSDLTKFLSDYTAVLFITLIGFNPATGMVLRSEFIFEQSTEGVVYTMFRGLAAPLTGCALASTAIASILAVALGVGAIVYTLLVLNDLRLGGHHLTLWQLLDLINCGLLGVHLWWQSRELIFNVDGQRLMNGLVVTEGIGDNKTVAGYTLDTPASFEDMQYALLWDFAAQGFLGLNLVLFSVRLFGLLEVFDVTRVIYLTVARTFINITYFLCLYAGMLGAFAFGCELLLSPVHAGFGTFWDSVVTAQRMSANEVSIVTVIAVSGSNFSNFLEPLGGGGALSLACVCVTSKLNTLILSPFCLS